MENQNTSPTLRSQIDTAILHDLRQPEMELPEILVLLESGYHNMARERLRELIRAADEEIRNE